MEKLKSELKGEVIEVITTFEKEVKERFSDSDLPKNISMFLLDNAVIEVGKITVLAEYIYRLLGLERDDLTESGKILKIFDWMMTRTDAIEVIGRKQNQTDLGLN